MKEHKEKVIVKELTSKELSALDNDPNKPSLVVVILLELLEWCFWGGLLFIFAMFLKPVWQPIWRQISILFN